MSDGFAYLDIIFFAMVAAFIAFRLRNVLGRRTGQERRRPSAISSQRTAEARAEREAARPDATAPGTAADEPSLAETADPALRTAVGQVRLADPGFDLAGFLEGAKAAFAMIVEAFARGDKAALRPLLSDEVFASFAAAIDERDQQGRTLTTELISVAAAEAVAAAMRGTVARLTVRFRSEQINVTRDRDGAVVDGDPQAVLEAVDIWTFERETRSRDPNWLLVETRTPEG